MFDSIRKEMCESINSNPNEREALEKEHGKDGVWDTEELKRDFEVIGFMAPFCVVKRRKDGKKGSVAFQHHPRLYFGWVEDRP